MWHLLFSLFQEKVPYSLITNCCLESILIEKGIGYSCPYVLNNTDVKTHVATKFFDKASFHCAMVHNVICLFTDNSISLECTITLAANYVTILITLQVTQAICNRLHAFVLISQSFLIPFHPCIF